MDPLEIEYDSLDLVPETFRPLYSEKDGKAVLTGVNGLKTNSDVMNLQEALRKERSDKKVIQDALKPWSSIGKKPEEILSQLDRISELEAAAAGKMDESAITKMVEARLGQKVGPIERQLRETTSTLESIQAERDQFRDQLFRRDMSDSVRAVANEMKVLSTAVADVELFAQFALERQEDGSYITKSGIAGVTPGLDVKSWLKEMMKARPHWWPQSQGGGANGAGGFGGDKNPWSAQHWNLTEQGRLIRDKGMATAEAMAKAAGSFIGATGPKKK